jgi:dephospho-CoA kinase
MKIVALVGMPGSGKSEVASVFEQGGFARIRFGDITDEEVRKRGLPINEENERKMREMLRKEHGMAAYAILNIPKIDTAAANGNVVLDGLYSWEEFKTLKDKYGDELVIVHVCTSPRTRYTRLGSRKIRPLTPTEGISRDYAEIENLNKGGPIAMADFVIINEGSYDELAWAATELLEKMKNG